MDIERTMEFILNAQARAEIRAEKADMRADAQKATERSLKAFINSMRHGRNGNTGREKHATSSFPRIANQR